MVQAINSQDQQRQLSQQHDEVLYAAAILSSKYKEFSELKSLNNPPADVRIMMGIFNAIRFNERHERQDWKSIKSLLNSSTRQFNFADLDIDNLSQNQLQAIQLAATAPNLTAENLAKKSSTLPHIQLLCLQIYRYLQLKERLSN